MKSFVIDDVLVTCEPGKVWLTKLAAQRPRPDGQKGVAGQQAAPARNQYDSPAR